MGTINEKLDYLSGTKEAIKSAIIEKGTTVPDGATFRSYADLINQLKRSESQEKTVTPTGEQFDVLPDDGYLLSKVTVEGDENLIQENIANGVTIYGITGTHVGKNVELSAITVTPTGEEFTESAADGAGFNEVTVEGDSNLQPQNIAEGVEIYGVTGTMAVTASSTFPTEYEYYRSIVEEMYIENMGEEPPSSLMVLESNGDITFGYFLSNWKVTAYDSTTTDFCAIGWVRISYHKSEDSWVFDDFSSSASTGENYVKNIRYCTKSALFYNGEQIWPIVTNNTQIIYGNALSFGNGKTKILDASAEFIYEIYEEESDE